MTPPVSDRHLSKAERILGTNGGLNIDAPVSNRTVEAAGWRARMKERTEDKKREKDERAQLKSQGSGLGPVKSHSDSVTWEDENAVAGAELEHEYRVLREKKSGALRKYYDRATARDNRSGSSGRDAPPPMPNYPQSPIIDDGQAATLAAAERKADLLREQMGRSKRPEKKGSRLNIGRLFNKDKKRDGDVYQDIVPPRPETKSHKGVHDLYAHYETRAFAASETDEDGNDRDMSLDELPHNNHLAAQEVPRTSSSTAPRSPNLHPNAEPLSPHSHISSFRFPNATSSKPRTDSMSSFPLPSPMLRRMSGPPCPPPLQSPPQPPSNSRKAAGWDAASTRSSGTGTSRASRKSVFSKNLGVNSVLSLSSDDDSETDEMLSLERELGLRVSDDRPRTSGEDATRNGGHGHQRKRSKSTGANFHSSNAAKNSENYAQNKYLTIPLPSPISPRFSGPWNSRDNRQSCSTTSTGFSAASSGRNRERERDSGSTIRAPTGNVLDQFAEMQSQFNKRRLSRASTLKSVPESAQSRPASPEMLPSTTYQEMRASVASSQQPPPRPRRERRQSATGERLMEVTPQERALLAALREKRARMHEAEADAIREEALREEAEMEKELTEGLDGLGIGIQMLGFEFPAPPSMTRRDSSATANSAGARSRRESSATSMAPSKRGSEAPPRGLSPAPSRSPAPSADSRTDSRKTSKANSERGEPEVLENVSYSYFPAPARSLTPQPPRKSSQRLQHNPLLAASSGNQSAEAKKMARLSAVGGKGWNTPLSVGGFQFKEPMKEEDDGLYFGEGGKI